MSFQQGLSGLNASSKNLDTIGNNVANANTVGFKQSKAQFSDLFAASMMGASALQIGVGTKVSNVAQLFTQGNITTTSNPLDTAISGNGFFRMVDAAGSVSYSRNGQFQVDKNGFLVNAQGHQVSGYMPNAAGVVVAANPVPLQLSTSALSPNPTTTAVVGVNLDSRAAVPITPVFNPADPTTYNNSTPISVYDSLGANHVGIMYFQRQPVTLVPAGSSVGALATTASLPSTNGLAIGNTLTIPGAGVAGASLIVTITAITPSVAASVGPPAVAAANGTVTFTPTTSNAAALANPAITTNAPSPSWNTYLTVDGVSVPVALAPVAPATVGVIPPFAQLTFDALGKLLSSAQPAAGTATPLVATTPVGTVVSAPLFPLSTTVSTTQAITMNFNSPSAASTQYGGTFGTNTLTQNGYTSGQLSSTSTGTDGNIMGRYSNGQTRSLGQIVLANFTSPSGLQPIGNNEWVETGASGGPLVGVAGSGGLGALQSSATEDSNVDLTAELVNMITAQRTYQANAQTIKTQDQLLQTIVSLR